MKHVMLLLMAFISLGAAAQCNGSKVNGMDMDSLAYENSRTSVSRELVKLLNPLMRKVVMETKAPVSSGPSTVEVVRYTVRRSVVVVVPVPASRTTYTTTSYVDKYGYTRTILTTTTRRN